MATPTPISPPSSPQACVIIAAYNAQSTIARAITSALVQASVSEVVVVDDASTDETAIRARSADDGTSRLKILIQPKNAGPSAARNRAIAESTAPWLTILDADDFYLENRVQTLLNHAENADFIADSMWQVQDTAIDGPRTPLPQPPVPRPSTISFEDFVLSNVTRPGQHRAELGFIKPLMRRSFLQKHALHYQEHMRLGEDFELYARALGLGARMLLLPEHGYVSVVRANSLSGSHTETDLLNLRDCDRHLLKSLPLQPSAKEALRQHFLSLDCRLQWRLLILAVKNKNPTAALATFLRPWPVPMYLLQKLSEQCALRGRKALGL